LKILAYEFYIHDPLKGIQFAGIFPERRKDLKRVSRDDIKKLGQSFIGKHLDSKKLSFNKVTFDSDTGRIIRPKVFS
jgi:hypothetical protein